jgi:hypothetical protein
MSARALDGGACDSQAQGMYHKKGHSLCIVFTQKFHKAKVLVL